MNIGICLKRHHYMKILGIALVVLALIMGMMSCRPVPLQQDLTILSTVGGNVITPGEGTFTIDYGTVVELVAEDEDNYYFVQWTGDVGTIADVESASTTITIEGDYTITAEFGFNPQGLVEYELTSSSTTGGSVTLPGEGVFFYEEGTVVELVADADPGHYFVHWSGDVGTVEDVESATTTIAMGGDYSITANFEEIPVEQVTLNVSSTSGGSVTDPGEGTFIRNLDEVINLVAEADDNYIFVGWTGDVEDIDDPCSAITNIAMNNDYSITANFEVIPMVAAGSEHTVGLTSNGTVVAVGGNDYGQCGVGDWVDIIQVAAAEQHTVGLTNNGTVVAVGGNDYGQCGVGDWVDIVQVGTGYYHTVGLTSNGTVVAVGLNVYGQCSVGDWVDIIQVAAGEQHTVGLKSDGTVVAVGWNLLGQCDVGDWTDIVQVAGGAFHTVGLKSDGTVVAVGLNNYGQCDVGGWTDIVQVVAGGLHTVGLEDDGSVVAEGRNEYGQCGVDAWSGIVHVTAGEYHTVGLKNNGTVVAVGLNDDGQCDVSGWVLS